MKGVTPEHIADVYNHVITGGHDLTLIMSQAEIVGYASTSNIVISGRPILLVNGLIVDIDYQNLGLGTDAVRYILKSKGQKAIGFFTTNEQMRAVGAKLGVYSYPLSLAMAATEPAEGIHITRDNRVLTRGRYGGGLYGKELGDRLLNESDEQRGDAEACVFLIPRNRLHRTLLEIMGDMTRPPSQSDGNPIYYFGPIW